ncbi:glycerol-3-phosphate cytidylyltransferase (plasmid) [Gemmobacter aquarius]|uniref:Glycerol-3-phosphate cytidylyltransferase n=1 Tax=Paragemmobacter aquarius TaxID=2169400 RepID=A0A2S0URY2_9RHOB|nr:adenylyltransferase/cytidyltransferase family protein [Gemmobacter aquarius]AWB50565.1 glycerol-3-phosphate cytidylyltransferase [Gemmobacter aquarius]
MTVIGYLSGTFDLFHVGHLNIIKQARTNCDHLVVGVHESGAWKGKPTFIPFDERIEIVRSVKFVDRAVKSTPHDTEIWHEIRYNKLFVGSDYFGSERFKRYEEFFMDKGVSVVYFPYTQTTSSSQIRALVNGTIEHGFD